MSKNSDFFKNIKLDTPFKNPGYAHNDPQNTTDFTSFSKCKINFHIIAIKFKIIIFININ